MSMADHGLNNGNSSHGNWALNGSAPSVLPSQPNISAERAEEANVNNKLLASEAESLVTRYAKTPIRLENKTILDGAQRLRPINVTKSMLNGNRNNKNRVPYISPTMLPRKRKHNPSLEWSEEEQSILSDGLHRFASKSILKRYALISRELPNRDVRDIARRVLWMKKQFPEPQPEIIVVADNADDIPNPNTESVDSMRVMLEQYSHILSQMSATLTSLKKS